MAGRSAHLLRLAEVRGRADRAPECARTLELLLGFDEPPRGRELRAPSSRSSAWTGSSPIVA
ncbi:MAG: hypothetical protein ABR583_08420, partial [Gaiellaceae bacterium]